MGDSAQPFVADGRDPRVAEREKSPEQLSTLHREGTRVSVVVPSYNHAPFVALTLRSIFRQTIVPAELFIILPPNFPEAAARDYLYQGISARHFRRTFNLADYVKVEGASFENGLLLIKLVREIPEAMKPRRIPISPTATKQIETKRAA